MENLKKLWDVGSPDTIELIRANDLLTDEEKENDVLFIETSKMKEKQQRVAWILQTCLLR